jgi:hypothetical protein
MAESYHGRGVVSSAVDLRPASPLLATLLLVAACGHEKPSASPDAGARELTVRVPAGLRLARALDTLTVSVDPAALATTTVSPEPGRFIGIASESYVYPLGGFRPQVARRGFTPGHDFGRRFDVYSTRMDGLPEPGTRYVAEVTLALFETDVPPGHEWSPHAGTYRTLWTRTLRQAEE